MEANFLKDTIGMRCLVLSMENEFLFFGKLISYDPAQPAVRITEYNDQPLTVQIEPETPVKVHIKQKTNQNQFILIEGPAVQITRDYLLVQPNSILERPEARDYFRQNVMSESVISFVNRKADGHPCLVKDISATGIAIQSKAIYAIGDRLGIFHQQFRPGGPTHNLEFIVVRKNALPKDCNFYGCKFIDLSPGEEDKLFTDIFALQNAELRTKQQK